MNREVDMICYAIPRARCHLGLRRGGSNGCVCHMRWRCDERIDLILIDHKVPKGTV